MQKRFVTESASKRLMIRLGNFFFHYRNTLFPVFLGLIFLLAVPPAQIFGSAMLEHVKDLIGLGIVVSGLALRASVIGFAYIKRGGLNKRVYAKELVTEGMFGLCRNPLYLGNLLIYFGIFLMHGNLYVIAIGTAAYLFIYQCIVYAEEEYLLDKFSGAYVAYCRDVPRWRPHLSGLADRYRAATEGMRFNVRRVIIKDYSTIAVSLVMCALVEFYEELAEYIHMPAKYGSLDYLTFLATVIVLCGAATLSVRMLKKRGWLAEAA